MVKQSNLFKGLAVFVLLILGGGVYLGMSQYMLSEYQISVKASHLIGIICAAIYYFVLILTIILSKVIPNLYEKHGALDDENENNDSEK